MKPRIFAGLFAFVCALIPSAGAYVLEGPQWPAGAPIVINLQLGPSSGALIDGSMSWGASAQDALHIWSTVLGNAQFTVVSDSTLTPTQGDGANSVFFSDTVFGTEFGSGVLAVTTYCYQTSASGAGPQTFTEADVVFNSKQSFNSYRGPLTTDAQGNPLYDFHRVALHEFGHLLGLAHTPQTAQAIMTPATTDLDALQTDDIDGAQSMYGAPATSPTPTPAPAPTPEPSPSPTPAPPAVAASVFVTAISPIADLDAGSVGAFNIARSVGNVASPLSVAYSLKGSAQAGVDYAPLTGTATITAGSLSVDVVITPLRETGGRKVKLTIQPGDGYSIAAAKAKLGVR